MCVRPNQKLLPIQAKALKPADDSHGGLPTGGKAVPQSTSKVHPSTISDEEPTKLFTCVLASIQSAKSEIDLGINKIEVYN